MFQYNRNSAEIIITTNYYFYSILNKTIDLASRSDLYISERFEAK